MSATELSVRPYGARRAGVVEAGSRRIVISFRNDDPSATSDVEHERRIAARFEAYGFAQTLGIVPWSPGRTHRDPYARLAVPLEANPEMVAFLHEYVARSGSEIALHGYLHRTHPRSRPWRREYFEFRRLGYSEAVRRLRVGMEHLQGVLGVRPRTFIPPWNRLDADTVRACVDCGIELLSAAEHTPTVNGLVGYGANCSLKELPLRLAELASGEEGTVFLNVLYHSVTTVHPRDLDVLERALEAVARCPQCEVLPLIEVARRYRREIVLANEAARNVTAQDELHGSLRARAALYRKVFRALKLPCRLEQDYDQAAKRFYSGRYEQALALDAVIEKGCKKLLRRFRTVAALGGMIIGALVALVGASFGFVTPLLAVASPVAALLALGTVAAWWATAPDSKREVLVFFAIAAAASPFGAAAHALARWLGGS